MKMMSLNHTATAATRQVTRSRVMIGKFFHTFENGEVSEQGVILGRPAPCIYLVQFHEWIGGYPGEQRLVAVADMAGWQFYSSAKEMRNSVAGRSALRPLGEEK